MNEQQILKKAIETFGKDKQMDILKQQKPLKKQIQTKKTIN